MGVVKDGTISGILPEDSVFAVHYPGYPSSTSRAVETLGGTEGILKARSSQSNSLELHFRPEDPYSHPAFGQLFPCNNLLLKISKKKTSGDHDNVGSTEVANKEVSASSYPETSEYGQNNSLLENGVESAKRGNEPQMEEAALPTNLSADIVARVSEAYQFNGMVDYQHVIAVHAAKKRKRHWAEVDPHFDKVGLMDMDQEDLMILVPPLFSPKDVPEELVLKSSTELSAKKKQQAVVRHRWEMDIEWCLGIDFDIEKVPSKINWEDHMRPGSDQWEWQLAVSELFDERPIWSKHSLNHRLLDKDLNIGPNLLRRLLFRVAYYFLRGPFRLLWIKKGYDPRKDPQSRIYQSIDFRIPHPLRNSGDTNTTDELTHNIWKDLCAFRVFPCKNQTIFQLSDLVDDYIQQEIRKPSDQTTCASSTGWLSSHELESLRCRVAVRFLSVYPKMGAEHLLRSASYRFEKHKRAHALRKDVRPEASTLQLVNKDTTSPASKTSPLLLKNKEYDDDKDEFDNPDDNDGEENIDEEEEEEFNEYESFELDGEDADVTLPPYSYPVGENISKNYLQELFGSFPGGDNGQDADCSDGEYQIFNQDSDDSLPDDDDL